MVQVGSVACATVCLDAGLEVDSENGEGLTPLMLAAAMGHEDVLLLLLRRGASILKAFLPGAAENLLHFCVEHVRLFHSFACSACFRPNRRARSVTLSPHKQDRMRVHVL